MCLARNRYIKMLQNTLLTSNFHINNLLIAGSLVKGVLEALKCDPKYHFDQISHFNNLLISRSFS